MGCAALSGACVCPEGTGDDPEALEMPGIHGTAHLDDLGNLVDD